MRLAAVLSATTMLVCALTASTGTLAGGADDAGAMSACERVTSEVADVPPSMDPVGVGGGTAAAS